MTIVVNTPAGIEHFQLLSMQGRLKLEVDTGLKFRLSTLAAVNHKFGTTFRTKKQALKFIEDRITADAGVKI